MKNDFHLERFFAPKIGKANLCSSFSRRNVPGFYVSKQASLVTIFGECHSALGLYLEKLKDKRFMGSDYCLPHFTY